MRKTILMAALCVGMSGNLMAQLTDDNLSCGDEVTVDGKTYIVGPNVITNGYFNEQEGDEGLITGWTVGSYQPMSATHVTWYAEGGHDGGAYICSKGSGGANSTNAIVSRFDIETGQRYYLSYWTKGVVKDNPFVPIISLTNQLSTGGGQNECAEQNGSRTLIGQNGDNPFQSYGYTQVNEDNQTWCQTSLYFDSEEYTYIQVNARWLSSTTCFDDFFLAKLYDPETISRIELLGIQYEERFQMAQRLLDGGTLDSYVGLQSALSDAIMEADITPSTEEEYETALNILNNAIEAAQSGLQSAQTLSSLIDSSIELVESTDYPGMDAFVEVIEKANDLLANEEATGTDYEAMIDELKEATNTYRSSQGASEENPADYTSLVDNPTFEANGKWYASGVSGGSQGTMTVDGVRCWQAWQNSAQTGYLGVAQDLTDLPNGYYKMEAKMSTQRTCLTDQHLVITSTLEESESAHLTDESMQVETGAGKATNVTWETLTTGKVLVYDGCLTIGAEGSLSSTKCEARNDYRIGSFWLADVKLYYLGAASDEAIAAATAQKYTAAKDYAQTMHLAGDKTTLLDAIDAAQTAADLTALNEALAAAEASENKYSSVTATNAVYTALTDSAANATSYSAAAKQLVAVPLDYMTSYLASADASADSLDAIVAVLTYYRSTLLPALLKAEAAADTASAKGRECIEGTIASVEAALASYTTNDQGALTEQTDALNHALYVNSICDITIADGADLTSYIVNADFSDTFNGWQSYRPVGNGPTNKGQAWNGANTASDRYIDSYSGTAGTLRGTFWQTLEVPNGTYTLTADARSNGAGLYLFASDHALVSDGNTAALDPEANTVMQAAECYVIDNATYSIASSDPEVTTTVCANTYGALWAAAADRIKSALGLTPMDSYSLFDLAVEKNNGEETCPDGIDPIDWSVFSANSGKGWGWSPYSLTIEVTDRVLTIGVSCDYLFLGHEETEKFDGTWISADNFRLTLDHATDENWDIASGISSPAVAPNAASVAIFSLSGQRLPAMQQGVNIVRYADGSVKKVFVK